MNLKFNKQAELLLALIATLKPCFASNKFFAIQLGYSERHIARLISCLRDSGQIKLNTKYDISKSRRTRSIILLQSDYPSYFSLIQSVYFGDTPVYEKIDLYQEIMDKHHLKDVKVDQPGSEIVVVDPDREILTEVEPVSFDIEAIKASLKPPVKLDTPKAEPEHFLYTSEGQAMRIFEDNMANSRKYIEYVDKNYENEELMDKLEIKLPTITYFSSKKDLEKMAEERLDDDAYMREIWERNILSSCNKYLKQVGYKGSESVTPENYVSVLEKVAISQFKEGWLSTERSDPEYLSNIVNNLASVTTIQNNVPYVTIYLAGGEIEHKIKTFDYVCWGKDTEYGIMYNSLIKGPKNE